MCPDAADLAAVLAMRSAGEATRMSDVRTLLSAALADDPPRLATFEARVRKRETWARDLTDADTELEDWDRSLAAADDLVNEVLGLAITKLLRDRGVEMVSFAAGEALLAELYGEAGVPPLILGQTQRFESIDHTRATVSLRFPGTRIWELPFLGHEFGHHATAQLRHRDPPLADRRPLQEVKETVTRTLTTHGTPSANAAAHASELLADCVGTIVCGPVLAVACLCLRVPAPTAARVSSPTHPSWFDRVASMRATLDAMSDVTGWERYRQQRSAVIDPLAAQVLGEVPDPAPVAKQTAQLAVATIDSHRPTLVYRGADEAIRVRDGLAGNVSAPMPVTSVRAIVDGVWRWRLVQPDRQSDAAAAALALDYCGQLIAGAAHGSST